MTNTQQILYKHTINKVQPVTIIDSCILFTHLTADKRCCLVMIMLMMASFFIAYVVCSIRLASFTMYLNALIELTPWKFALHYIYYAWWIPVHLKDMAKLPNR